MDQRELERMMPLMRENLHQAGMIPNRIEEGPLKDLVRFTHESHLALGPFSLAIAYQAIAFMRKAEVEVENVTDS